MTSNCNFDFAYTAKYRVEKVLENTILDPSIPHYRYNESGLSSNETASSVNLVVYPQNGRPFLIGLTGDSDIDSRPNADGIWGCPSSEHFLVIADSIGIYVDSVDPSKTKLLNIYPIRKVHKSLATRLLLVMDFKAITALGVNGILWTSDDLVRDGVNIDYVMEDYISGHGDPDPLMDTDYFKISTLDGTEFLTK
jgi:hypothetical protein